MTSLFFSVPIFSLFCGLRHLPIHFAPPTKLPQETRLTVPFPEPKWRLTNGSITSLDVDDTVGLKTSHPIQRLSKLSKVSTLKIQRTVATLDGPVRVHRRVRGVWEAQSSPAGVLGFPWWCTHARWRTSSSNNHPQLCPPKEQPDALGFVRTFLRTDTPADAETYGSRWIFRPSSSRMDPLPSSGEPQSKGNADHFRPRAHSQLRMYVSYEVWDMFCLEI